MNSQNIDEDGDEKTTFTPTKRYKYKCQVCNGWVKKGRCEPCYARQKKKDEALMLEVDGKLPAKARIGYI